MDQHTLLENILKSQSEMLASSSTITSVISDTAGILVDQEKDPKGAPKRGGSIKGRLANLPRDFEGGYQRLFKDHFAESPVYTDYLFRRRFCMHRHLFVRIVDDVAAHDQYFVQKKNALGQPGLRPIEKICLAIRMLAYGGAADANNEYLRISESTSLESLSRFCSAIIKIYGEEYLQSPIAKDVKRTLTINEKRGFPGMLGSLDCMHWAWKNCPAAWKGQYQGKEKVCSHSSHQKCGSFLIYHLHFKRPPLSWRLWFCRICGSGMLFLVCPDPITTSPYSTSLRYSPIFLTVWRLNACLSSMETSTIKCTSWRMGYTLITRQL
jgi:hypothetical protein